MLGLLDTVGGAAVSGAKFLDGTLVHDDAAFPPGHFSVIGCMPTSRITRGREEPARLSTITASC